MRKEEAGNLTSTSKMHGGVIGVNLTAGRAAAEELSFKGLAGLSSKAAHVSPMTHLLNGDRRGAALNMAAPHRHRSSLSLSPPVSSTLSHQSGFSLRTGPTSRLYCDCAASSFLQAPSQPRVCLQRTALRDRRSCSRFAIRLHHGGASFAAVWSGNRGRLRAPKFAPIVTFYSLT